MDTLEQELRNYAAQVQHDAQELHGLERRRQELLRELQRVQEVQGEVRERVTADYAAKQEELCIKATVEATKRLDARGKFVAAQDKEAYFRTLDETLFDNDVVDGDRETIESYEHNKGRYDNATNPARRAQFKEYAEALLPLYEKAHQQEEKRKEVRTQVEAPITAGIIARKLGEDVELYVSVPMGKEFEGLFNGLTNQYANVLAQYASDFDEAHVEGLTRLRIQNPGAELLKALNELEPNGFADAQVHYKFILVEEMPQLEALVDGGEDREEDTPVPRGPAAPKGPPASSAVTEGRRVNMRRSPAVDASPASAAVGAGEWINYVPTIEIEGKKYIAVSDTPVLTGMNTTTLYNIIAGRRGGEKLSIPTARHHSTRDTLVELESLLRYFEENERGVEMLTFEQAATRFKARVEEVSPEDLEVKVYQKRLYSAVADGFISTLRDDDKKACYINGWEFQAWLHTYVARRTVNELTHHPTVDEAANILGTSKNAIRGSLYREKLDSDSEGNVTTASLKRFLHNNIYTYKKSWQPKKAGPRKKREAKE